jgi:hypothetical protein
MVSLVILLAVLATGLVLILPKIYRSVPWRATITPLASIIGSGFLVLGPILVGSFGAWAILAMGVLCLIAYWFGAAIRFNINRIHNVSHRRKSEEIIEKLSSWVLAFAYIVSVAYYLNLLGAFGVSLTPFNDPVSAKMLTTGVFVLILLVGWFRGFAALERLEQLSVSLKLSIIVGLLVGLAIFFAGKVQAQTLVVLPAQIHGWAALTLLFGLLVTVQGFETSRYLSDEYEPEVRIRTMKWSQWISTAIYLGYIGLMSFVFAANQIVLSETGIIQMMKVVAPILPLLLVAAALSAQFSAAVADTGGAGGLFQELSKGRISQRNSYALLVIVGVSMTWAADIFSIIRYASLAFAAYYGLQAGIAAIGAWSRPENRAKAVLFAALAALGALIVIFGQAVEV